MEKLCYRIFLPLIFLVTQAAGQSVIPVNIQKAIDKGFRTTMGIPGKNYFQNHSDYRIQARFDPKKGRLSGSAEITYYNISPDTLKKIVLRFYQNIAKKGGIRDEEWKPENINSGVKITALRIGDINLIDDLNYRTRSSGTNMIVYLPEHLNPGDSLAFEIGWNFYMPVTQVHRYGKYDDGTYFVSLWYPQIAVYDDIDGWDEMNYTGTHEFYNDFNNYVVSIKVPEGFMVWATGNWTNAEKILNPDNYRRYKDAGRSDNVIRIIKQIELEDQRCFIHKGSNTFQFSAGSIPDFAFGVSDQYVWDAASVLIDSLNQRRVLVNAAYCEGTKYFDSVAAYGCNVLRHFSFASYNYPFPYDQITVFNGSGGMEYPMIVNNGSTYLRTTTIFVTMHEIAHAYFPFLTGINERKYSWIDEGLTTYLPIETEAAMQSDYYPLKGIVEDYRSIAGTEYDIPFTVPAYQTREQSYLFYSYTRSSMAFHMLEMYLGREDFRNGIKEFIKIWRYKHPTPYDLFAVIKQNTSKEIDWFIDQWFYQSGWPDLSIGEVTYTNDSVSVEISCDGVFAVPVVVALIMEDSTSDIVTLSPEIWKNKRKYLFTQKVDKKIIRVQLGDNTIPDITPENNIFIIE